MCTSPNPRPHTQTAFFKLANVGGKGNYEIIVGSVIISKKPRQLYSEAIQLEKEAKTKDGALSRKNKTSASVLRTEVLGTEF